MCVYIYSCKVSVLGAVAIMHHCITFILLVFAKGIFANEPLLPARTLRSDLEGVISIYSSSQASQGIKSVYMQYGSYELTVGRDGSTKFVAVTCAKEGSKCKYYDQVRQEWKETNSNKIFFDGENFFDKFEVIRVKFENDFLLLLTIEKINRLILHQSLSMTYKSLPDFLSDDTEIFKDGKELVDLKAIYVDETPDHLQPHPVYQTMFLLDSRLKKEAESVTILSSSGIFSGSVFLGIRNLELQEYMAQYSRQGYGHKRSPISITPGVLKKDLAILDPDDLCLKKATNFVGFLEYKKELFCEVQCVDKKYRFAIKVKFGAKEVEANLRCPKVATSNKKNKCRLEEVRLEGAPITHGALFGEMDDGDRLVVVAALRMSKFESLATLVGKSVPIVHYFQLDDFFKTKLLVMQKLLRISRGNDCQQMTFLMPSLGRRDFTVPITFDCQSEIVEIGGRDALVVLDDHSMDLLTVRKLLFNLQTKEFESPDRSFEPGNPKAIRFVGTWQSESTVMQWAKKDILLRHIMDDLKELREQYLEAAAGDPEAAKILSFNGDILLLMHGEKMINGVRAVVIKTNLQCNFKLFTELYFTGDKLLSYDSESAGMQSVNTESCTLSNNNLENSFVEGISHVEDSSVKGISYLTENDLAWYMKPFTTTIQGRCAWYNDDTIFRFVIYDPDRLPVLEGLFYCSLEMYHFKGPAKVLSQSGSLDAVEDFFVFKHEEVVVTATDAHAVKLLNGRTIDAGPMGPPILFNEKWAIALQIVAA